jgi:hypothetical protein
MVVETIKRKGEEDEQFRKKKQERRETRANHVRQQSRK